MNKNSFLDQLPLPLVSVVTPSYNQGHFIQQTIESVLNQDYYNLEYWVIDGGSHDNTINILREYECDCRFHWISEPDHGQADAINKGWQRCNGEILSWINSDDTYLDGAVTSQVNILIGNPNAGIVYGDALFINTHNEVIGQYHSRPFNRERFLHLSAIPQPTVFFRSSLLETCGLLNINLQYALDYEFFLKLMWTTDFLYTAQTIATYRLHDQSKTVNQSEEMLAETITVVRHICQLHSDVLAKIEYKAVSDWFWTGAINSASNSQWKQMIRHALSAIQTYPIRPRMLTFFLKLFDISMHTTLSEQMTTILDQFAKRVSKQ
jgi:glycosyltransferase involved in cell wall biosynthesis